MHMMCLSSCCAIRGAACVANASADAQLRRQKCTTAFRGEAFLRYPLCAGRKTTNERASNQNNMACGQRGNSMCDMRITMSWKRSRRRRQRQHGARRGQRRKMAERKDSRRAGQQAHKLWREGALRAPLRRMSGVASRGMRPLERPRRTQVRHVRAAPRARAASGDGSRAVGQMVTTLRTARPSRGGPAGGEAGHGQTKARRRS